MGISGRAAPADAAPVGATSPHRPAPPPLGTLLTISLLVVVVLATLGSFSAGFGVLQTCTDLHGDTGGDPCRRVVRWASWTLGPLSIALLFATTSLAHHSN